MFPQNPSSPRAPSRFSFITLGCKSNQYDSAAMAADLRGAGLADADSSEADVIVVNTCMVTGPAQAQCRKAIRQARRENPHARLVVSGCMTRGAREDLEALGEIDLVLDPDRKGSLVKILGLGEADPGNGWSDWPEDPAVILRLRDRAFLKIQDGCDSACSYCVVPSVRGPSRSLDPEKVCQAVGKMMESGFSEVVLTGIHLGQYGRGIPSGITLEALLSRLAGAGLPGRIRLSSLEPHEITDELLSLIKGAEGFICRHIHLAVQSASTRILGLMNRPYGEGELRGAVRRIRETVPGLGLGCDVICGFPGETAADFARTESLLADFSIPFVHAFPFSPRPGTPASLSRNDVPHGEKKARVNRLRSLVARNRRAFARDLVGSVLKVAMESGTGESGAPWGLADNYMRVKVKDGEGIGSGRLVDVRVDGNTGDCLEGKAAAEGRGSGVPSREFF